MQSYIYQIICLIVSLLIVFMTLSRLNVRALFFYIIKKNLSKICREDMTIGDSLIMRTLLIAEFEVDRGIFANQFSLPRLVTLSLKCVDAGLSPPTSEELESIATNINFDTTIEYLHDCVKVVYSILALRCIYNHKKGAKDVYLGYIFDYLNEYDAN